MSSHTRSLGIAFAMLAPGCGGDDDRAPAASSSGSAGMGGAAGAVGAAGDSGAAGAAGASGVSGAAGAACDAVPQETGDARFDTLVRELDVWRTEVGVTALAIGIVEDGKAAQRATLGRAHRDGCTPLTDRAVFHLNFVTPVLTHVAALRSDKLDLDAPIDKYVSEIAICDAEWANADWKGQVTIGRLLDGTAGFWPNYKSPSDCSGHDGYFNRYCAWIGFEPGTAWSESHRSTVALAVALERVTGQPFRTAMKQELFEPFGMEDATYEPVPAGTTVVDPTPAPPGVDDPCAHSLAEFSALASLRDMHQFAEAILQPDLIDRMFLPDEGSFTPGGRRVVNLFSIPLPEHGTLAWRSGSFGFGSLIAVIPEKRFAVVIGGAGALFVNANAVLDKILANYGLESAPYDASLPRSRWSEYDGIYATRDGSSPMEVYLDGETLRARDPGTTQSVELVAWYADGGLAQVPWGQTRHRDVFRMSVLSPIRFYRDAADRPDRIVSMGGDFETRYRQ